MFSVKIVTYIPVCAESETEAINHVKDIQKRTLILSDFRVEGARQIPNGLELEYHEQKSF